MITRRPLPALTRSFYLGLRMIAALPLPRLAFCSLDESLKRLTAIRSYILLVGEEGIQFCLPYREPK